jgi:hypothetical protein
LPRARGSLATGLAAKHLTRRWAAPLASHERKARVGVVQGPFSPTLCVGFWHKIIS